MRAALLFAMPFVASASQAADEFGKMLLTARQDQSFVPTVGGSVTCLPPNSICGRYCKIVSKGDVCCPENYVCPGDFGGSFCLAVVNGEGRCCPNGEDPNTCARRNGIALPDKFASGSKTPAPAQPSITASVYLPTLSTSIQVPSVALPTLSTSLPPVIIPTANATNPAPTGLVRPSVTPSPIQPFTGAAARCVEFRGALLGMIVGAVAWVA